MNTKIPLTIVRTAMLMATQNKNESYTKNCVLNGTNNKKKNKKNILVVSAK
jgi:hypothetical protein